jgi:hypothetical protein
MARERALYDHKSSRKRMTEPQPNERERGGGDASMSERGALREAQRSAGRGMPTLDKGRAERSGDGGHEITARHERERHEMRQRHHQEREHAYHQQALEHENLEDRHEDEHAAIRQRHAMEERQNQSGEGGAAMGPREAFH